MRSDDAFQSISLIRRQCVKINECIVMKCLGLLHEQWIYFIRNNGDGRSKCFKYISFLFCNGVYFFM